MFITTGFTQRTRQISLEDILAGEVCDLSKYTTSSKAAETATVTIYRENISGILRLKANVPQKIQWLRAFNSKYAELEGKEKDTLFHTFYIPKKTHGFRRIDAPCDELSLALRELGTFFKANHPCYHTSAFAYVEGRSTIAAIQRHQSNKSRWFLKTDFSNFFGNTTFEFTIHMLEMIYPFGLILEDENGRREFEKALSLAFWNGGLPQGTPLSPLLTNVVMIPIDHKLNKELRERGFVYTRYADDMQISHRYNFKYKEVVDIINNVLRAGGAPFELKEEKTRYGSSSGRNWNLGLMLNKDNEITIGYKRMKGLKAACHNYIMDRQNGNKWEWHDVMHLIGNLSYLMSVNKDSFISFIDSVNKKHGVNIMKWLREDQKGD